jgi:hypothetical protein
VNNGTRSRVILNLSKLLEEWLSRQHVKEFKKDVLREGLTGVVEKQWCCKSELG